MQQLSLNCCNWCACYERSSNRSRRRECRPLIKSSLCDEVGEDGAGGTGDGAMKYLAELQRVESLTYWTYRSAACQEEAASTINSTQSQSDYYQCGENVYVTLCPTGTLLTQLGNTFRSDKRTMANSFQSVCACVCVRVLVRVRVAPRPLCVVVQAAAEANFKIRQQCRQQTITAESSAEQRLERCTLCASERKREHTGGRSKYLLCCESVYFKTQLRRTPFYFHTAASLVQTPYSSSSSNSYNNNNNSNSNNN